MRFLTLGSSAEIGASCHYLSVNGCGLILDAGADPNSEGIPSLPRYDLLRGAGSTAPRHVFITHAHQDHVGGLATLVDEYPGIRVCLTEATRQLAEFMLHASARLQRRRFKEGESAHPPLFDEELLDIVSSRHSTHEYGESFPLLHEGQRLSAQFFDAGHVLGSAGVLIRFEEDDRERSLYYTSDTNTQPQAIIPGGAYPEPPIDILVMESTLGADPQAEHSTRADHEDAFCEALKAVIARGGCVLVPVFMLGRAQEVLSVIQRFKNNGLIPKDLPVYTAGGMREVSNIYDQTRLYTPRIDQAFKVSRVRQRRFPFRHDKILSAMQSPAIFVLASGMMFEKTLSNRVAQLMVEEEKHAVFVVGYCKKDSPGRRIQEALDQGLDGVVLNKEAGMQPLRCQVERFRFSGHSNRQDLVALAKRLHPKKTVLVHGETAARAWMADAVAAACPDTEVILPEAGQVVEL